jgi:hypothetical protein
MADKYFLLLFMCVDERSITLCEIARIPLPNINNYTQFVLEASELCCSLTDRVLISGFENVNGDW